MMLQAAAGPVYIENIKQFVLNRAKLDINSKNLDEKKLIQIKPEDYSRA